LNKKLSDPNKSYQELIKLKDYNKNTLPLLTSCLRELRNIEELPDFVKVNQDDKEVLLVNIKKHMMITDLINSLFQYQKIDIEKKEPIYSFLVCLPVLSHDDVESRSQEIDKDI